MRVTDVLDVFREKYELIESELIRSEMLLIGFSRLAPFSILNLECRKRIEKNRSFLQLIRRSIAGLEEILLLWEEKKNRTKTELGFAENLFLVDRFKTMSVPVKNINLSTQQRRRLNDCILVLEKAEELIWFSLRVHNG